MKKYIGLGIGLAVVIGLIASGTWAVFTDTETSSGNTVTAGTIDISLDPSEGQDVETASGAIELKPCQTGWIEIFVTNDGTNPCELWKHIGNVVNHENDITEPEQEWYDAWHLEHPNGEGPENWNISDWIHYDMTVCHGEACDELIVEADGFFLTGSPNVLYGTIGGTYLVTIDHTTGDVDNAGAITMTGPQDSVNAIAYDSQSGTLYGLARSGGNHLPQLATIDVCTGAVTIIGQIVVPGATVYFAEGIAVNPSGTIYVSMSMDGDFNPGTDYYSETLATVNPVTAVATPIGTIGPTVQNEADGLEFIGATLFAGTDDPGSGPTDIYAVDPNTAVATFKGTLSSPRFNNVGDMAYNSDLDLLYGSDPGAHATGTPRHLCTISQPGVASATDIGLTHTAGEFGGGLLGGLAWAPGCQPGIECQWIYLGVLDPGEQLLVKQSYHPDIAVDNWGQSDKVTFDIDFVAQQIEGALPPPPGPVLPGHGRPVPPVD